MTEAMPFLRKLILLSYDPRPFQTAFFFLKWGIAFYRKSWYKISSTIDLSAQERNRAMRKLWKKMKNKQGFTLMEMLIVVAIIAVLVAIAIPVYQGQVHKAKVAADVANVRAYYAELQADYLTTGTLRPDTEVPYLNFTQGFPFEGSGQTFLFDVKTIHFLNGQEVTLQAGSYLCTRSQDQNNEPVAYHITYYCNEHHDEHNLTLG